MTADTSNGPWRTRTPAATRGSGLNDPTPGLPGGLSRDWEREDHQIVEVISPWRLIDAHRQDQPYWRSNRLGLDAGWYVVTWAPSAIRGRYSDDVPFQGPYATREEAIQVLGRREREQ